MKTSAKTDAAKSYRRKEFNFSKIKEFIFIKDTNPFTENKTALRKKKKKKKKNERKNKKINVPRAYN